MDVNSIQYLSSLLSPPEGEEAGKESELDTKGASPYATPGSIGPQAAGSKDEKKDAKEIWCSEEVEEVEEVSKHDSRPEPEYEMVFKQDVSPEDIFLGMTNKTPLTAACEHLVLRIKLPDIGFKDINLNVTNKHVDLRTPIHRLGLYLPHAIEPNSSKARWLRDESVLEVTMKIVREYDFLNK